MNSTRTPGPPSHLHALQKKPVIFSLRKYPKPIIFTDSKSPDCITSSLKQTSSIGISCFTPSPLKPRKSSPALMPLYAPAHEPLTLTYVSIPRNNTPTRFKALPHNKLKSLLTQYTRDDKRKIFCSGIRSSRS